MSNQSFMYKKIVETWADIEREIEKEAAFLEWLEYKPKQEAMKEAKDRVHAEYKELIERLRQSKH